MMTRFFRFHVSGDIPDASYLARMVEVASRQPHCQILCFTKRYELVDACLTEIGPFPTNLHLILSAWRGLPMVNPHTSASRSALSFCPAPAETAAAGP